MAILAGAMKKSNKMAGVSIDGLNVDLMNPEKMKKAEILN